MEPLEIAQGIVRGTYSNIDFNKSFTNVSGIYKFTNEDISSYFHHLQNKKEVLSVISSGNHILNAILGGASIIDGFDISIFPEYYLFLQIAAIITLSKEEYIEYFLSYDRDVVFSDKYYDRIRENLNGKYKEFWDYLYNYNDDGYEIYESLLFRTDFYAKEIVIERNPFLQGNNYEKLKNILKTEFVKINTMVINIIETKFTKEYDLILLSNIMAHCFDLDQIDELFTYLESNFRLKKDGKIIDFDFDLISKKTEEKKKRLNRNSYIEELKEGKILVYKKEL